MGLSDFNQLKPLRNQLVIPAGTFGGEQILALIQIPTKSQDMDEQLKLDFGVVDVLNCPNRKISVTMLRYNVDKHEGLYAQFRFLVKKQEEDKRQQIVYVKYTLDKFI